MHVQCMNASLYLYALHVNHAINLYMCSYIYIYVHYVLHAVR